MKNWKTTSAAILLFLLSLAFEEGFITIETYSMAVALGASLGLWASKDATNKESEQK